MKIVCRGVAAVLLSILVGACSGQSTLPECQGTPVAINGGDAHQEVSHESGFRR